MKYPAYPRYKESGVDWLGSIPLHWELKPLFSMMSETQERNVGNRERNVLSLSYGKIIRRDFESNFGLLPESFETYQIVQPGNVVMRLTDLQNDQRSLRVGQVKDTGIITSAYVCLKTRPFVNPLFAYYLLHGYDLLKVFYGLGGGLRQTMRFHDLKRLPLLYPGLTEQRQIISFLDQETVRIDMLIAKQERLIELLSDKRESLITYAVTKGLNQSAPMKDTRIEWLGEIPDHWEIKRVKWVAKMESGHTPDKKIEAYWTNCDIPWVSLNDTGYLKNHDYISETASYINSLGIANSSAHILPPRAVVFSRDATIGRCAITTKSMAVSQHFIAWLCGSSMYPEYLLKVFKSMSQDLDRMTMGATVKTIGMPDVKMLITPVPPLEEQSTIVNQINLEMTKIDAMLQKAVQAIGLLNEHRDALISAAVTGKIDVRQYAG